MGIILRKIDCESFININEQVYEQYSSIIDNLHFDNSSIFSSISFRSNSSRLQILDHDDLLDNRSHVAQCDIARGKLKFLLLNSEWFNLLLSVARSDAILSSLLRFLSHLSHLLYILSPVHIDFYSIVFGRPNRRTLFYFISSIGIDIVASCSSKMQQQYVFKKNGDHMDHPMVRCVRLLLQIFSDFLAESFTKLLVKSERIHSSRWLLL